MHKVIDFVARDRVVILKILLVFFALALIYWWREGHQFSLIAFVRAFFVCVASVFGGIALGLLFMFIAETLFGKKRKS